MKNTKLADMSLEQLAESLLSALPDEYRVEVPTELDWFGRVMDDDYIEVTRDGKPTVLELAFEDDEGTEPQPGEKWLACNVYTETANGLHKLDPDAFRDWELQAYRN